MESGIIDQYSALLFSNGAMIAFDKEGEQMSEYQGGGWDGIVKFFKDFPNCKISFAVWEDEIQQIEIPESHREHLVETLELRFDPLERLRNFVNNQITGINRSSIPEASRGALNAFKAILEEMNRKE